MKKTLSVLLAVIMCFTWHTVLGEEEKVIPDLGELRDEVNLLKSLGIIEDEIDISAKETRGEYYHGYERKSYHNLFCA